jgi:uncharacterized membrane protein YhhN
MILPILATCVTALALPALLHAERALSASRPAQRARRAAKLVASSGFAAVAIAGATAGADWGYGHWIAVALVLGALGDVALLGRKRRALVAGMSLFALDHLGVLAAVALVVPPADWPIAWGLLPLGLGAAAVARLWPDLGLLRAPVAIYTALLAAMLTAAAAPLLVGAPPQFAAPRPALLAAGGLCFFLSDLAVARQRFVRESFWNKAWGLPLYYSGQLLIAWSAAA